VEGAKRQEIFHDDEDLKAKMVKLKRVDEWRWSSCRPYYGIENQFRKLLDPSLILGMFSEDQILARERFKEFNLEKRPEITGMVLVVKTMRTVPVSIYNNRFSTLPGCQSVLLHRPGPDYAAEV